MKHRIKGKKLNRNWSHRKALKKSLVRNLVEHGKIETTISKAKYVKPFMERLITIGKKNTLASRRVLISRVGDKNTAKKITEQIAPLYKDVNGGYTRIRRTSVRVGDRAQLAVLSFTKPITEKGKVEKTEGKKEETEKKSGGKKLPKEGRVLKGPKIEKGSK